MVAGMHTGRYLLVPALLSLAFIASGGITSPARATPIDSTQSYSYTTSGSVGVTAGAQWGFVTYSGNYSSQPLLMPGSMNLGQFQVQWVPDQAGVTYANMPFSVTVQVQPTGSTNNFMDQSQINIKGVLNGTLQGNTISSMTASITDVSSSGPGTLPFSLSDFHINAPQLLGASGNTSGWPNYNTGYTTLTAYVSASEPPSIPEPSTVALFGAVLGIAGWQRLRRRNAG